MVSSGIVLIWLVVWNMNFIFPYIGNNNTIWLSYFSDGLKPPTSYYAKILWDDYHPQFGILFLANQDFLWTDRVPIRTLFTRVQKSMGPIMIYPKNLGIPSLGSRVHMGARKMQELLKVLWLGTFIPENCPENWVNTLDGYFKKQMGLSEHAHPKGQFWYVWMGKTMINYQSPCFLVPYFETHPIKTS
jgi:hypothetical protein